MSGLLILSHLQGKLLGVLKPFKITLTTAYNAAFVVRKFQALTSAVNVIIPFMLKHPVLIKMRVELGCAISVVVIILF